MTFGRTKREHDERNALGRAMNAFPDRSDRFVIKHPWQEQQLPHRNSVVRVKGKPHIRLWPDGTFVFVDVHTPDPYSTQEKIVHLLLRLEDWWLRQA